MASSASQILVASLAVNGPLMVSSLPLERPILRSLSGPTTGSSFSRSEKTLTVLIGVVLDDDDCSVFVVLVSDSLEHAPTPITTRQLVTTNASARDRPDCPVVRVDVFTLFPQIITDYCGQAILGRAIDAQALSVHAHNIRDAATDAHKSVDDMPFGGGAGMVMSCEPLFATFESTAFARPLIYLSPGGRRFDQSVAQELAALGEFSLLCGRYEGIDQRVIDTWVDDEISLGDFVLAGGELAALAVIEAAARLVPGVLGNAGSALEESFSAADDGTALLEYPQYTRPASFRGLAVPPVLLSGDHGAVAQWRLEQAKAKTRARRPDLLEGH